MQEFETIREETMPNGQKKALTKEDSGQYRVQIFSADGQDWDWEEYGSHEEALRIYERMTDLNDLSMV